MYFPWQTWDSLIISTAVALVAGIIVHRVLVIIVRRASSKGGAESWAVFIRSLGRSPILWFVLAGANIGLQDVPSWANQRVVSGIREVLLVMLIIAIAWVVARIGVAFVRFGIDRSGHSRAATSILATTVRLGIYILALLSVLRALGLSITPILTALGVGGLAVALALQDTLSNLFAGFHILMSKNVRPGDYVKLSSLEEGYVTDIAWRNTMIRSLAGTIIIVPNAKLASSIITNMHLPEQEMNITVDVGVRYGSDLHLVETIALGVARDVVATVKGGVPTFEPMIRFHTFADTGVRFVAIVRVSEFADQFLLKHEFVVRLDEKFRAAGIEMPVMTMMER
jgi:small-conductance mechanosensitive channel